MLIENSTIWETRIQNVDALLTAATKEHRELYYLATVCQIGVDPPLLSVAPNPEYPICAAIQETGTFAINLIGPEQGHLIAAAIELDPAETDKISAMAVSVEVGARGAPLLLDCLQSIECRLVGAMDLGDHRTFIGEVVDRRRRRDWKATGPHRFRGGSPSRVRLGRLILQKLRVGAVIELVRRCFCPQLRIAEGTRQYIGSTAETTPLDHSTIDGIAISDMLLLACRETERNMTPELDLTVEPDGERLVTRRRLAAAKPGVCLVGCGWWGAVHALELERLGSRVRRYFLSRDIERARAFSTRFDGDDVFGELDAALADPRVDAVLLALPHHLHAEATLAAVRAGKHVLVEKPIALTLEEGEAVVRAADDAGICLAVAEQYRLSPLVRRAHELIEDGLIGPVTQIHAGIAGTFRPGQKWKTSRETMGGGVLLDVGVHYVSIMRLWLGAVSTVWAATPPKLHPDLQGEDAITALLQFEGGAVADLSISWSGFRSPEAPNLEVIGERGSLRLWFRRPYVSHSAPLSALHWSWALQRLLPWRLEHRVRPCLPQSRERRIPVARDDLIGSTALLRDFVDAITTGRQPAVPGADGLEDLRVVLAAYEALECGQPVRMLSP